jgi:hypothetical protein
MAYECDPHTALVNTTHLLINLLEGIEKPIVG